MTTESSKIKQKTTGYSFSEKPSLLETTLSPPPMGRQEKDKHTSIIIEEERQEVDSNLVPDYLPPSKPNEAASDDNEAELAEFE
jgi:hypothetical protein